MKEALLDDEAAGDDLFADVVAEAGDGAVGVPGDVGVEFERMAADRVAEKLFFPAEALEAVRLDEGNGGKAVERLRREEGDLLIVDD